MHASPAVLLEEVEVAAPAQPAPLLRRVTLDSAVAGRLLFAQVREDPQVEIDALRVGPGERVVVVASGGCTALSLLASGAGEVTAVDLNPVQNHLVELKAAAVAALGAAGARAFLGASRDDAGRRADAYARLRPLLGDAARAHWDAASRAIESGVLHSGVTERFIRLLATLVRVGVQPPGRIARLLACASLDEQRELYRAWNNRRWRLLFHLLLNRVTLERALDPAMFRGASDLARHFHALWERALTEQPAAGNWFLHELLTGGYPAHIGPPYLDAAGARRLRAARSDLTLVDGALTDWLRRCPDASVDGFALSNVCEWLDAAGREALCEQVARVAAPGARLVLRDFVGRTELPASFGGAFLEDRAAGEELSARERSLMQRRVHVWRAPRPRRGRRPDPGPRVRPARAADDGSLVRLSSRCVMRGDVSLCVERAPSFFALSRLEGRRCRVAVTEEAEGVTGCITVSERLAFLEGRPARSFYVSDLKVAPERRDGRTADALCEWARNICLEWGGPRAPVLVTVLAGNRAMERRLPGPRGLPRLTPLGTLRVHALPFLRRPRPPAGAPRVEPASERDLPEMAELWRRVAPSRQLAPAFDADSLGAWIAAAPGLEAGDYLLARDRGGRLLGFVGLWDQAVFKQLRVVGFSRRMALFRRGLNLVAPLLGVAPLPPAGSELRSLAAVNLCVPGDAPHVLRALLLHGLRARRGGGHAFISLGLDRRDPLSVAMRGLLAQPTDVHACVTSPAGAWEGPALDGRPLHFETALV